MEDDSLNKKILDYIGNNQYSKMLTETKTDDLDKFAHQCAYCMSHGYGKYPPRWIEVEYGCKLGALWQQEQEKGSLKEKVKEDLDELFQEHYKEVENFIKWELTKDAIEREVKVDAGGYPYIDATELYDYANDRPLAKAGDKVKIIILLGNNNGQ